MKKYTGKNLLSILDEAVNGADDGMDDNVLYSLKREFRLPSGYRWRKAGELESPIYYIASQYITRYMPSTVSVRNIQRYDIKSDELVSMNGLHSMALQELSESILCWY